MSSSRPGGYSAAGMVADVERVLDGLETHWLPSG